VEMMEAAQRLLNADGNSWLELADTEPVAEEGAVKGSVQLVDSPESQLRLL
jgi:hypothetical protein